MNLRISTPAYCLNPIESVAGQSFVVTGAAGSIGSEVCRRLVSEGAFVTGVDIDENGLTYLRDDLGDAFTPSVLDIRARRFDVVGGTVIHCAARKHVAIGETHRAEYISANVEGTARVLRAAIDSDCRMLLVSTDKAVNPTSVMGRTKRWAELKTLAFGHNVIRLVNVYGSRGSVIPRWRRQVEAGQPCTVTDWNHRRFYMTPQHAAWEIIIAATSPGRATITVPSGFVELTTRELFEGEFPVDPPPTVEVGAKPGERDHEELRYEFEGQDGTHGLSADELAQHRRGVVIEV